MLRNAELTTPISRASSARECNDIHGRPYYPGADNFYAVEGRPRTPARESSRTSSQSYAGENEIDGEPWPFSPFGPFNAPAMLPYACDLDGECSSRYIDVTGELSEMDAPGVGLLGCGTGGIGDLEVRPGVVDGNALLGNVSGSSISEYVAVGEGVFGSRTTDGDLGEILASPYHESAGMLDLAAFCRTTSEAGVSACLRRVQPTPRREPPLPSNSMFTELRGCPVARKIHFWEEMMQKKSAGSLSSQSEIGAVSCKQSRLFSLFIILYLISYNI